MDEIYFKKKSDVIKTKIDRIIRIKELKKITGLKAITIWREEKKGSFPKRRPLSINASGWLESEIQSWLKTRDT